MADFSVAYAKSMKIEGGYANNPNDSGGETWKGIARNKHPNWSGWLIVDRIKMNRLQSEFEPILRTDKDLQKRVLAFYKEVFWDIMKLDQIKNQPIAEELFDTGINMGDTVVVEFLQRALNATNHNGRDYPDIDEDGKVGNQTITVLNDHPRPDQVLKLLNCQQGVRYMEICRIKPSQEQFMTSWLSRVHL